jgi:AcrR family transcriptional regulator
MARVQADDPDYRQRAGETKRRRTREKLIGGVLEICSQPDIGMSGFVDQVCTAAGVSSATLYNHFNSKFGLLQAAYRQLLSPIIDPIKTAYAAKAYQPTEPLHEIIRYIYSVSKLAVEYRSLVRLLIGSHTELPSRAGTHTSWISDHYRLAPEMANCLCLLANVVVDRQIDSGALSIFTSTDRRLSQEAADYHCNALLFEVHYRTIEPFDLARRTLSALLPTMQTPFPPSELDSKLHSFD